MRRVIYIVLFDVLFVNALFSQNIHQIKSFADSEFSKGNYSAALKEYQRVQFFDAEKNYQSVYARIAEIYFNQADYNAAVQYFNFAWNVEQNDSIKFEIALKKALCYLLSNDYYSALNELFDISVSNNIYFENKINLYSGICYFGQSDYNEALSYLTHIVDSKGAVQLNALFKDFEKYNKRFNPERIELMSSILPGLGQIYIGKIGSGVNSIVLLTGVVAYAFYTMSAYSFIDGALVLSSWFYRYYKGGAQKANLAAEAKLKEKKSKVYSEIISIVEKNIKSEK